MASKAARSSVPKEATPTSTAPPTAPSTAGPAKSPPILTAKTPPTFERLRLESFHAFAESVGIPSNSICPEVFELLSEDTNFRYPHALLWFGGKSLGCRLRELGHHAVRWMKKQHRSRLTTGDLSRAAAELGYGQLLGQQSREPPKLHYFKEARIFASAEGDLLLAPFAAQPSALPPTQEAPPKVLRLSYAAEEPRVPAQLQPETLQNLVTCVAGELDAGGLESVCSLSGPRLDFVAPRLMELAESRLESGGSMAGPLGLLCHLLRASSPAALSWLEGPMARVAANISSKAAHLNPGDAPAFAAFAKAADRFLGHVGSCQLRQTLGGVLECLRRVESSEPGAMADSWRVLRGATEFEVLVRNPEMNLWGLLAAHVRLHSDLFHNEKPHSGVRCSADAQRAAALLDYAAAIREIVCWLLSRFQLLSGVFSTDKDDGAMIQVLRNSFPESWINQCCQVLTKCTELMEIMPTCHIDKIHRSGHHHQGAPCDILVRLEASESGEEEGELAFSLDDFPKTPKEEQDATAPDIPIPWPKFHRRASALWPNGTLDRLPKAELANRRAAAEFRRRARLEAHEILDAAAAEDTEMEGDALGSSFNSAKEEGKRVGARRGRKRRAAEVFDVPRRFRRQPKDFIFVFTKTEATVIRDNSTHPQLGPSGPDYGDATGDWWRKVPRQEAFVGVLGELARVRLRAKARTAWDGALGPSHVSL